MTGEPEPVVEEEKRLCGDDDLTILVDDSDSDSAVKHLRGRWELASVLNFLNVLTSFSSSFVLIANDSISLFQANLRFSFFSL